MGFALATSAARPMLQQLLLLLLLMILCKCNSANLSNDHPMPINSSTNPEHPHASIKNEPASIDLLHLWHLINPPSDATTTLQSVRVDSPDIDLNDFTRFSTSSPSLSSSALSSSPASISSPDSTHQDVAETIHKVPYYVPNVCNVDSFVDNFNATLSLQKFKCLPSSQYTCNSIECLCKDKSAILIHLPPIGQLCLSQDLKLNQSCLLDSQCLTSSGFRCQPNEHLNGSSALQQFVALFALRWRVALLAASAGLSNELHAELGWNLNGSLSLNPLNSESSSSAGALNSIDGDVSAISSPEMVGQRLNMASKLRFPLNSLFNRLAAELSDNSEHKLPGHCFCEPGHFLSYALRYDANGIASRQLHSLLNGVGSTLPIGLLDSMISGKETAIAGRCVRIRSLGEPCQLSAECMKADPQTSCRRNRCTCRSGYTSVKESINRSTTATTKDSITFKQQVNETSATSAEQSNELRRTSQCVAKHLVSSATNALHSSSAGISFGTTNPFDSTNGNKRNCSQAEVFCTKSGRCIRRPLKRHLQQNLVSIVWTTLCLLSVLIVLGSLLARSRRHHRQRSLAGSHGSLANGRMGARALSNGSIGSLSLLGVLLGRTVAINNLNNRTPAQQQLISKHFGVLKNELINQFDIKIIPFTATCTPPPEFSEIMDPCPTYEEACRMLQKISDDPEHPDQIV